MPIPYSFWNKKSGANFITNGLLAWWKFDESSGTTAYDSSGNGNNATLNGFGASPWVTGKIGGALSFNASGYCSLAGIVMPSTFTITFWCNSVDADTQQSVFCDNGYFGPFLLQRNATTYTPYYYDGGFSAASGFITNGVWSFIAITFSAGTVTFYINGNIPDSNVYTGKSAITTAKYIGGPGSPDFLDMPLDDLRVYNRVLSTAEIGSIYNLAG